MKKRWLCWILALCLVIPMLPAVVKAAPEYTASGSLDISKPSKEEIFNKWTQLIRPDTTNPYEVEPSTTAPYSTGKVSQHNLQSALTLVNYYRFLANLPAVTMRDDLNEAAQYGPVVLAANKVLTHYPTKPADMDEEFFNKASAATSSSNLSSGVSSLTDHISGCIYDRGVNNLAAMGHRRWLLSPTLKEVGFGMAGAYAGTKVFTHYGEMASNHGTSVEYDYIAWPSSGNFPESTFSVRTSWSVTINPKKYSISNEEDLKVTLTREADGTVWVFDKNTPGPVSEKEKYLSINSMNYGYGGTTIIFTPGSDNIDEYSGLFTVKVEGLTDKNGNQATIGYQVDFFSLLDMCSHDWQEATCTTPKTCTVCGTEEGYKLGHKYPSGVCYGVIKCTVCGFETVNETGHRWWAATCETPKFCAVCNATEGEAWGHLWKEATCVEPKICTRCYRQEGKALGHAWQGKICDGGQTCSRCQLTQQTGHDYWYGTCTTCGGKDPNYQDPVTPQDPVQSGDVVRLAGNTRYATAFAAADELKKIKNMDKFSAIIVSSGEQFADALAGSYLASVKDAPILLVKNRNKEINEVKEYIKANLMPGGTMYLLGGEAAVPKTMETGMEGFVVSRLGGNDRYATNLRILEEAGLNSLQVVVCTGKNFADSLSASALGLPILLVKDQLTGAQMDYLTQNTGKELVIIGGKNAVSEKAERQLAGYGIVSRLAGNTRYETSTLVAKTFFKTPYSAVVAYGKNFPDGLSGGPVAYATIAPLILTEEGKEKNAADYMAENNIRSGYVLGGTAVLPDKTVNKVFGQG